MVYEVLWQSTLAGLATVLGALIVLALGRPGERLLAILLGFAGGVMTAVVIFDLIPSALNYGNILTTITGFMLGLIFMLGLNIFISLFPGLIFTESASQYARFLKMGYLIAVGIALHDLPEGIAIAVGYSAKESLGILIALSIGLHNIPEGMATAAPLTMGGVSRWKIILICLIISIFTPLGAYLGLLLVTISVHFICLLLALAGGAMAFIVRNELMPESQRRHPNFARLGFIFGLIIIFCLGIIHH
ncbi:MAG: ZIP family metal transporter [Firmicutes bacterium HGW-Firmicutes-12]|jgi:ZIP family zinc transporter|nr:MAG: ZIP family metal transporter [Firmicutes bacterium HGW-Firmicutes-12]